MVAAPLYYVAAASYVSFALEVVWFGSLVAGSVALDADRVHHGTLYGRNHWYQPATLSLPAWQLHLQIMSQWPLTISYDLLLVQFSGIVDGSIVMDVKKYVYLRVGR
jgi:hypothetical protein